MSVSIYVLRAHDTQHIFLLLNFENKSQNAKKIKL